MTPANNILLGGENVRQLFMNAAMGNRHGIISGATGTGKTVTLQVLAEAFFGLGVPVFMADIKGDLSGLGNAGSMNEHIASRAQNIAMEHYQNHANPVVFWDLFGQSGHPIRTTISDMGPLLLSSLLELNDTQTGVLYSGFKIADDHGLLLLDLKDLRSLLSWMGDNARELKSEYGNISPASIGAIQRRLLVLEQQGAEHFFGEPALQLEDLGKSDFSGNGVISILDATELVNKSPRLYATFLLWLLSELYENLPEVGDTQHPRLVLFFDEAHLLFNRAPMVLVDKIEQITRLIRSKGVGVFFISQNPTDIPEDILGQLGLRIQHALRAYTPKDRKTIRSIAATFRANPDLDTERVIGELATGEALVSVLDGKGSPTPVQRILLCPPASQIGPVDATRRREMIERSPFNGKYDQGIDRESAYELLKKRAAMAAEQQPETRRRQARSASRGSRRQSVGEALIKSAARSIGSQIGRQLIRGIMGSLLGGRR